MQKFVVARYNFNSLFKDAADKSFIQDLMVEPYISEKSFEYAIGNLHEEEESGHHLIRGTFGRVRKGNIGKVYDKKKKEFLKKRQPEIADVTLDFIINHSHHLIFFELNSKIPPAYASEKFLKIYSHTSSVADLEIDFIFIESDVYETIQKWDRIERVSFKKLRPSNPSSFDDFKDIERLLKETKSENTSIDFNAATIKDGEKLTSSQNGLDPESELIKQGIALSSFGYGEAKIKGKKNGEVREVETKKFLKKVEVDFFEDGALKKITQTIEEITRENDK